MRQPKLDPMKKMLWQSMRIFKAGFTVPTLLQVVPGSTPSGVSRWVMDLERHQIITRIGGTPAAGQHQKFKMVNKRESVTYPFTCTICGNPLHRKCIFFDSPKKETQTQTERGGTEKRAQAKFAAMTKLTPEELEQAEAELWPKKEKTTPRDAEPAATDYPDEGYHVIPEGLKRRLEETYQ